MPSINKLQITNGTYWIDIPGAGLKLLCGCPADIVKHLIKKGLIVSKEENGVSFETGPNVILLSDIQVQNGAFSNLSEFPILQMLYLQGMILPNHPNNNGEKPMLIGTKEQVESQLQYIYRGNYGLSTIKELQDSGTDPKLADLMLKVKLNFSFGNIKPSDELVTVLAIENEKIEIREGVFIKRVALNQYEIEYNNELVTIDLNLSPGETYSPSYHVGHQDIKRHYFEVVHSGDGNGWDCDRPCMASIIFFQGRIYLIDAGPNILYSLEMLGIGLNEVTGIFHTHAHDDHFAGLPDLMHTDHKLKYYAAPYVRFSVMKKLAALLGKGEDIFYKYFDVHDLELDSWNNIGGLEVRPIYSPHPVDTNILYFRALSGEGYKSYAHLADITSFTVLDNMDSSLKPEYGLDSDFIKEVKNSYLIGTDLKKIDAGGGLIHGSAEDFTDDPSTKIIISHKKDPLSEEEKRIGSSASFGMFDVLIPCFGDTEREIARGYLYNYFPDVPSNEINALLNNEIITHKPETLVYKKGEPLSNLYLILTGTIELLRDNADENIVLSAGALIGEITGLYKSPASKTYRSINYVRALTIPVQLYQIFVQNNQLYPDIEDLKVKRDFFLDTWLFNKSISYPVLNNVIRQSELLQISPGPIKPAQIQSKLCLIKEGKFNIKNGDKLFEEIGAGDFFGEENILFNTSNVYSIEAVEEASVFAIDESVLSNIPEITWKLFETYSKRLNMAFHQHFYLKPIICWQEEYTVEVHEMDLQHKTLFEKANALYVLLRESSPWIELSPKKEHIPKQHILETLEDLIEYTRYHFESEEKLLEKHKYEAIGKQQKEHAFFVSRLSSFENDIEKNRRNAKKRFIGLFKDWFVNHILQLDRQYSSLINKETRKK
jgi:hemerythrin